MRPETVWQQEYWFHVSEATRRARAWIKKFQKKTEIPPSLLDSWFLSEAPHEEDAAARLALHLCCRGSDAESLRPPGQRNLQPVHWSAGRDDSAWTPAPTGHFSGSVSKPRAPLPPRAVVSHQTIPPTAASLVNCAAFRCASKNPLPRLIWR